MGNFFILLICCRFEIGNWCGWDNKLVELTRCTTLQCVRRELTVFYGLPVYNAMLPKQTAVFSIVE